MELENVEGYEEELPEDMREPDQEFSEDMQEPLESVQDNSENIQDFEMDSSSKEENVSETETGSILFSTENIEEVVKAYLEEQEASQEETGNTLGTEELDAVPETEPEPVQEEPVQEAFLDAEGWEAYLLTQKQYQLELSSHLQSIRNLNVCILTALGVVVGCLLIRQFSQYFR